MAVSLVVSTEGHTESFWREYIPGEVKIPRRKEGSVCMLPYLAYLKQSQPSAVTYYLNSHIWGAILTLELKNKHLQPQ